ncbi:transglutaminase-like cysteine peptidase [Sulfurimonas sp. SAG-AH-194-I05]|nr:transglutaminase-like cysteine peptidase [Sulfurimonas sp. SAG-AH-194-I05]
MKIMLLLLLSLSLYANVYPYFNKSELITIEKSVGKMSKNRALDYQNKVQSWKKFNKTKQLNIVNRYLNQLLPQYDDVTRNQEDYWASPKEFLITGYGDCEDYAIIKYFTLIKLGFDEKKLFLTTVHEQYTGGYHMVLSYFKDKKKSPLVLDNLSFRILTLETRKDIKADMFINSKGVYKMKKNHTLKKISNKLLLYTKLIKKIKKNN